jgi:hypothetical protein
VLRGVLEHFEILNQFPALIVGKTSAVFVARIRVSGHRNVEAEPTARSKSFVPIEIWERILGISSAI